MAIAEELAALRERTLAEIAAADTSAALEAVRVAVLGKSGTLTGYLRSMGQVPAEERASVGRAVNAARVDVEEALAARKEFDRLVYTLRTDWIRKHATGFNGGQLRKANTRLSLLALTGTNLCDGLIAGAEWNNLDHVLDAYNLLAATPLPCDDTSDRGLWRETNLAELHRRQHVEGAANRELLLILCAQIEALIKPGTWADKDDIDLAQTYYHTLADLGYPTSDEENKALNGCFLPEDDEAE